MARIDVRYVVDISNDLLDKVNVLDHPEIGDIKNINVQIENLSKLTTVMLNKKNSFSLDELSELEKIHFAIHRTLAKKSKKTNIKGIKKLRHR